MSTMATSTSLSTTRGAVVCSLMILYQVATTGLLGFPYEKGNMRQQHIVDRKP